MSGVELWKPFAPGDTVDSHNKKMGDALIERANNLGPKHYKDAFKEFEDQSIPWVVEMKKYVQLTDDSYMNVDEETLHRHVAPVLADHMRTVLISAVHTGMSACLRKMADEKPAYDTELKNAVLDRLLPKSGGKM